MDLEDFRDERKQTETCFQLQCGHAFHTRCLVDALSHTQMQCPACNHYKSPETKFKLKGLMAKARAEISRDPEVQAIHQEVDEAEKELRETGKEFRDAVRAFAREKAAELQIRDKRNYQNQAVKQLNRVRKEKALERGPEYAATYQEDLRRNRYWNTYQLRHPGLHVSC